MGGGRGLTEDTEFFLVFDIVFGIP
jgi:hypothetical protein